MKRLIALLSLLIAFNCANACTITKSTPTIHPDGNVTWVNEEVYMGPGSCSPGDNEVQKPKPKPTKDQIDYVVERIRFNKKNHINTRLDEDELIELLSR